MGLEKLMWTPQMCTVQACLPSFWVHQRRGCCRGIPVEGAYEVLHVSEAKSAQPQHVCLRTQMLLPASRDFIPHMQVSACMRISKQVYNIKNRWGPAAHQVVGLRCACGRGVDDFCPRQHQLQLLHSLAGLCRVP